MVLYIMIDISTRSRNNNGGVSVQLGYFIPITHVRLFYNPYFLTYFFSLNDISLSQYIKEQYLLFSEANGIIYVLMWCYY
jgi:hypothetical protein